MRGTFSRLCYSLVIQDPGLGDSSSPTSQLACYLEEGAPVVGGNSMSGTFAMKGAHGSEGRGCRWNSRSLSLLGLRAAHSYMAHHVLGTDILKGEPI